MRGPTDSRVRSVLDTDAYPNETHFNSLLLDSCAMFSERTIFDVLSVEGERAEGDERKARRLTGAEGQISPDFRGRIDALTVVAPSSLRQDAAGNAISVAIRRANVERVNRSRVDEEGLREVNLSSTVTLRWTEQTTAGQSSRIWVP